MAIPTVQVTDESSLAVAERCFVSLTTAPVPLALDCDKLAIDAAEAGVEVHLPAGLTPLPVLRAWLIAHPAEFAASDAVWAALVLRARLDGPQWVVAAVGMATPALAAMAGQLRERFSSADRDDIANELLTGFLEALRDRLDLAGHGLFTGLRMAAWRSAWRMLTKELDSEPVADLEQVLSGSRSPRNLFAHPDLLVGRAVQLGVLDAEDAQAWIDVRLGHRALEPHAVRLGISAAALRMRLARADGRLYEALVAGDLSDVISEPDRARMRRQAATRAGLRRRNTAAVATAARVGRLLRQQSA